MFDPCRVIFYIYGQGLLSYICNDGFQFQMERRNISCHRPRFLEDGELGHFTLFFFAEGGKEMYEDL